MSGCTSRFSTQSSMPAVCARVRSMRLEDHAGGSSQWYGRGYDFPSRRARTASGGLCGNQIGTAAGRTGHRRNSWTSSKRRAPRPQAGFQT